MKKILMEDIKINRVIKRPQVLNLKKTEDTKPEEKIPVATLTKSIPEEKFTDRTRRRMSMSPRDTRRKPVRGFLKFSLLTTIMLGVVFWTGVLFKSAYVTITAKQENIEYKIKAFSAGRNLGGNYIDFEIMIESEKKSKDYILTESKEVSSKATGSIVLFNEFSTKSEKLLTGTYVSDQDGKTYRLNSTVNIPGYKMDKQKKIPGQVEVEITSFLAGESYNGTPEKFYINSFKGTTKYSKIYGVLQSELKGGIQGLVYYLEEEDLDKLKHVAESSFKDELFNKVRALLPSGYILYPGAIKFSYEIDKDVLSDTPETKVPITGILSAVLIKEESLIKNIIKQSLPTATKEEIPEITIDGVKDLIFTINSGQLINKSTNMFDFQLTGSLKALWNPNKENLRISLSGAHKDNVLPIFRENKGITKAMVKIFPPWDRYLPNNPSKININIQ